MKILILTSSNYGTAAHHLPNLIESNVCDISMVILSLDMISDKNRYYRKKIFKIIKIGLLGALNGVRMRKWFNESVNKYKKNRSLEDICQENNIPFYKTPMINCDKTRELFQQADSDLGVSLRNGYIGRKVFSIPKYGMINIHHEILPEFQNAQSIIWQIYNMSYITGYTIHKIDQNIDTGEILHQEIVPINFLHSLSETVSRTSALLLDASSKGLIYVIQNFEFLQKQAKPQGIGSSHTTPTIWQYIRIYRNYNKIKRSITQDISNSKRVGFHESLLGNGNSD